MSFLEKRNEIRPSSGEAPFDIDEVFFSRTDTRGVIQSGNYVFRRVAHYDWSELQGAPHKIIRHPDMPRGVFRLLWDTIKSGRPIGAYVKNLAQDGLHYWVFAVVVPNGDGYLSARIKPTSPLLAQIERLYAELRRRETDEGLGPEESARALFDEIAALGFSTYESFSTHALSEELIARDSQLEKVGSGRTAAMSRSLRHAEELKSESEALIADFNAMETVPHNLRVIASRIEPTGGPISTLSKNYGSMSRDMSDWFEANVIGENSNFAGIKASVTTSLFIHGMSRILDECDRQLAFERRKLGDLDIENERSILRGLVAHYTNEAQAARDHVLEESRRILAACDKMDRHVLGLSTTRVMCKIESARTSNAGDSLGDIIAQLKVFQDRISGRLDQIIRLGREIQESLES